jgi:cytosine/adenosine deaminase-related metal-dependent hydrolase
MAQDGGAFDAEKAFELGTLGGARVCNLEAGALQPGLLADFVAIDLNDLALFPDVHLLRSIVYALQPTAITDVFVGAKPIVRNRRLAQIQEGEVRARVRETAQKIGLKAV